MLWSGKFFGYWFHQCRSVVTDHGTQFHDHCVIGDILWFQWWVQANSAWQKWWPLAVMSCLATKIRNIPIGVWLRLRPSNLPLFRRQFEGKQASRVSKRLGCAKQWHTENVLDQSRQRVMSAAWVQRSILQLVFLKPSKVWTVQSKPFGKCILHGRDLQANFCYQTPARIILGGCGYESNLDWYGLVFRS